MSTIRKRAKGQPARLQALLEAAESAADWLCDAPDGSDQKERGDALRTALRSFSQPDVPLPDKKQWLEILGVIGNGWGDGDYMESYGTELTAQGVKALEDWFEARYAVKLHYRLTLRSE